MDIAAVIARLEANARVFTAQVAGVGGAQARWKPAPDRWSIVEVVCHLVDEETRDFRTRLDLTLHAPGTPWPPIDPVRWVDDERYAERDVHDEVARFAESRAESGAWLRGLDDPDWSRSSTHPRGAIMTAADLLGSWLAHDLIHVRQINRLHRQYLESVQMPDVDLGYAGEW